MFQLKWKSGVAYLVFLKGFGVVVGVWDQELNEKNFFLRTKGKSYNQISKEGGGILSSIQNVRNASEQEIFDESFQR